MGKALDAGACPTLERALGEDFSADLSGSGDKSGVKFSDSNRSCCEGEGEGVRSRSS